jgi:hypothetical protein
MSDILTESEKLDPEFLDEEETQPDPCSLCGDKIFEDTDLKHIRVEKFNDLIYCENCHEKIYHYYEVKYIRNYWFLAKPRSRQSKLKRKAFNNADQFRQWGEDHIDDNYVYGFYIDEDWNKSDRTQWLNGSIKLESEKFYWPDDHRDDDDHNVSSYLSLIGIYEDDEPLKDINCVDEELDEDRIYVGKPHFQRRLLVILRQSIYELENRLQKLVSLKEKLEY